MSVPDHVNESLDVLAELHARSERQATRHQRGVERLVSALGRPRSLYGIVLVSLAWIALNAELPHFGMHAFDSPPFPLLQAFINVSALFITTMVLIVQNRQNLVSQKRSNLDLQVNLTSERKATKIIALLEELRRDMPSVFNRRDVEAQEMATAIDPKIVAEALEQTIGSDDVDRSEKEGAAPKE